jgi:hypothetical protein
MLNSEECGEAVIVWAPQVVVLLSYMIHPRASRSPRITPQCLSDLIEASIQDLQIPHPTIHEREHRRLWIPYPPDFAAAPIHFKLILLRSGTDRSKCCQRIGAYTHPLTGWIFPQQLLLTHCRLDLRALFYGQFTALSIVFT